VHIPLQDYDVYVAEKQPLPAGEEKHVISVFVADESGLINRVAGVFARRGVCSSRTAGGGGAEVLLRLQDSGSSAATAAALRRAEHAAHASA
jgi:acetolactate synthase-1/3 small subunit